jgi:hypothetical protein
MPEELETLSNVTGVTCMTQHVNVICNLLHSVVRCNTTGGSDTVEGCQY